MARPWVPSPKAKHPAGPQKCYWVMGVSQNLEPAEGPGGGTGRGVGRGGSYLERSQTSGLGLTGYD